MTSTLYLISSRGDAESLDRKISPILSSASWMSNGGHASSLMPFTRQGNQLFLNGRALPATWSQRSQRIGISDASLIGVLGVECLNTADSSKQPIQWFSQSDRDVPVLSTWMDQQYRYLDITPLAQQNGWTVDPTGNVLQITTPPSRVLGIRQGQQDWGDRIVVELDRPTPWQITEQNEQAIITIDASVDPSLLRSLESRAGRLLKSISVESRGNQTLVQLDIPPNLRSHVWTLANPNRLVMDIRSDRIPERDILWSPGIRWKQQMVNAGSNSQYPVVWLEVDPRQPELLLKPIWSNPSAAIGIAPLLTTAQRWQAVAAVNGGFFNRNNQLPLGAIRQDNRWISGPILNRGAIAWDDAGNIAIGRLSIQETIQTSTGEQFPVLHLNSGYVQAGIARYTSDWGSTYTTLTDHEIVVTVESERVIRQQVGSVGGQLTVPIPSNGYLLALRSYRTAANAIPIGTSLQRETYVLPSDFERYPHVVGAGPLLIKNRQIVLNPRSEQFSEAFIRQRAPRSAIGITDRNTLIVAAAYNSPHGTGPSLSEMAQIMQRLSVVDALNLDGGSSTTLYLGGQILNRSPQTAARVHNGIGIFMQPSF
ncbi:MAG: phosphodiester glycosidase family protein [Elainellaceae cyanobacterium]